MNSIQGPLNGITVVDLTQVLAGPFCTKMLVDLGARVIKVEIPGVHKDPKKQVRGKVPHWYYASLAYQKESIALNLKDVDDRLIFEKLLANADVLVSNYKGGTMDKLGYSWDSLHQKYPKLIDCVISGFGDYGEATSISGIPYRELPAMDHIAQAMSGIMSITGHEETPPHGHGPNSADVYSGTVACIGIQGAIISRMKDGIGRYVDISMLDANMSLHSHIVPRHTNYQQGPNFKSDPGDVFESTVGNNPVTPPRQGGGWYMNCVFDVLKCKDGKYIVVIAYQPKDFKQLCIAINKEEWIGDKRFRVHAIRLKNYKTDMKPELSDIFMQKTRDEWVIHLQNLKVPCGPVNSLAEMIKDPKLNARNMIATSYDKASKTTFTIPGNAVKISGYPDNKNRGEVHMHDEDGERIRSSL